MKTNIIKLREAEASVMNSNGDYNCALDRPIMLKDGDVVQLKSVFLDTKTAGGELIEVDVDLDLEIDCCRYFQNDKNDQFTDNDTSKPRLRTYQFANSLYTPAVNIDGNGVAGGTVASGPRTKGDNKLYYECSAIAQGTNAAIFESFSYRPKTKTLRKTGGTTLHFDYKDRYGNLQHIKHHIKRIEGDLMGTNIIPVQKLIDRGFGVVLVNTETDLNNHWIDYNFIQANKKIVNVPNNQEATVFCDLLTRKFTYTLLAGTYTPTQIGDLITDEMSLINKSGATGLFPGSTATPPGGNPGGLKPVSELGTNPFLAAVNNPFFGTIALTEYEKPTGSNIVYCREDAKQLIVYPLASSSMRENDRFIGASQVALSYDDAHKKMAFQILHTPMYVKEAIPASGNDGMPGVEYQSIGLVDKYSGVAITSLNASESLTKKPNKFWEYLGFTDCTVTSRRVKVDESDPDSADISINTKPADASDKPAGADVIGVAVDAVVGQTITGGFLSLDTPVQKNSNFRKPDSSGEVATAATMPIYGHKVFSTDYSNEGYYLIELDCGLSQSFVGGTGDIGYNSNKVYSIVGTYFENNNFTTDSGSGSIQYVHSGEPQLLSNIGVRVLNSDGTVPDNSLLGSHNTVFVEVISEK